jgi:Uma2 family endonuclease
MKGICDMEQRAKVHYTPEEYFDLEEGSSVKHEYWRGEIYMMAGGTVGHNAIGANAVGELRNALRRANKRCPVMSSDMKIHVSGEDYYTYADAVVICGKVQYYKERRDIIENPLLLVEVLSPSTANHDRTSKFNLYSRLESLQHYLLVEQDTIGVEYRYLDENGEWQSQDFTSLDDVIRLPGLDIELAVTEFYYLTDEIEPPTPRYSLPKLLEDITPENIHKEIKSGSPTGNEGR